MYASLRKSYHAHPTLPVNPILEITRECGDGDSWAEVSELLFALHRLWNLYQDPAMGTSPIDAWDDGSECALFDELEPVLDELDPREASRMIIHATRVAQRWYDMLADAGRDY